MSLSSEYIESNGRTDIASPLSGVPIYWSEHERACPRQVHADNSAWSFSLETRLRLTNLEAAVSLLEKERADLQREIATLEHEIQSREATIQTQKETIEQKDQQIQQLIDKYEAIIATKDRKYHDLVDRDETNSTQRNALSPTSRTEVLKWFKRIISG